MQDAWVVFSSALRLSELLCGARRGRQKGCKLLLKWKKKEF